MMLHALNLTIKRRAERRRCRQSASPFVFASAFSPHLAFSSLEQRFELIDAKALNFTTHRRYRCSSHSRSLTGRSAMLRDQAAPHAAIVCHLSQDSIPDVQCLL